MNNITETLKKGIEYCNDYNHFSLLEQLNKLNGIISVMDDNGENWNIVWEKIEGRSIVYAYFSQYYPVAFVLDACREDVRQIFIQNRIFFTKFEEPFECDEEIIKKYAPYTKILDDRFLDNGDFSIDDDRMYYIYEDIKYVTPYNFTFDEIR